MTRLSANLGFLWADRPLPDAIDAAKNAGFDAVECHWPYDTPAEHVADALTHTGLPMLGLNTRRGDVAAGENGLSALPGRRAEARAAVDEALAYAAHIQAASVHVMAGFAQGPQAHHVFLETLGYAAAQAAKQGVTILIEPLNRYDAPGYFLTTTDQAKEIIKELGAPNIKLMFDCYHVQLMEGDLTNRLRALQPLIGHIQIAGVPKRGPPDEGEVAYGHIFRTLAEIGYDAPLGIEYKPNGATDDTLSWMKTLRQSAQGGC